MDIYNAIAKRVNKTFVHNQKYKIGEYKIVIPSSSNLPRNQRKHSLYDRFLPILASHLTSGTIIDVGANIGDTLAAMAQNCSNSFICIEPSDMFFNYLEENANSIQQKSGQQIKLIKEMIGCGCLSGSLMGNGSTAHLEITNNPILSKHVPLDTLIDKHSDIVLIKSDVDGFDFDVIRSSEETLIQSEPILFWENEIADDFQYEEYSKLYDFLEKKEYSNLYIFDNFGNLLVEESNFKTLRNINTYLYNMIKYKATRTFFYTDILASTEKRKSVVENAIADYKNNYIGKTK